MPFHRSVYSTRNRRCRLSVYNYSRRSERKTNIVFYCLLVCIAILCSDAQSNSARAADVSPAECGCQSTGALSDWKLEYLRARFASCDDRIVTQSTDSRRGFRQFGGLQYADGALVMDIKNIVAVSSLTQALSRDDQTENNDYPIIVMYNPSQFASDIRRYEKEPNFKNIYLDKMIYGYDSDKSFLFKTVAFNFFVVNNFDGVKYFFNMFFDDSDKRSIEEFRSSDLCSIVQLTENNRILATFVVASEKSTERKCSLTGVLMHYGYRGHKYNYTSSLTDAGVDVDVPSDLKRRWAFLSGPKGAAYAASAGASFCKVVDDILTK